MFHKKTKTEPCLSPQSPFMRKPSKEFLQKITFNRHRQKQSDKLSLKSPQYLSQQNLSKIAFIPTVSPINVQTSKNQPVKLKKTTIQLGTFKIRHQNLLLKSELQEIQKKNSQLIELSQALRKQNQELRKQLQIHNNSRISKISQETLADTMKGEAKKINQNFQIRTQQSLEIESYEMLPAISKISNTCSFIFEQDYKELEDFNFLSSSINKQVRPLISRQKINEQKTHQLKFQIQMLTNRISYLQKQLQNCLIRQRSLQAENQSLRLCASMSKRKLDMKDSQLREIKIKEKKKKYFQKLFELSSQEDNQNLQTKRKNKSNRKSQ